MSSYVKRKEKESFEALMRRFRRMVIMSKTMTEAKERRFHVKPITKSKRRAAAVRKVKIKAKQKKELY
ncbi:30S ribosomal protein S21 [Patescibacteria group bacterium]|nr:30S ribosomal protein S21 [Patescibacteria group bacterium]